MRSLALTRVILGVVLALALTAVVGPGCAFAQSAWWRLNSTAAPTLLPRTGEAQLLVSATNLGDSEVNANEQAPVTLTDELPPGVKPLAVEQKYGPAKCHIDEQAVICTATSAIAPYHELAVARVTVALSEPLRPPLRNVVTVQGGDAPPARIEKELQLAQSPGEQVPFGLESYELITEEPEEPAAGGEGWTPATQAGAHPFQLTTVLDLDQTLESYGPGDGGGSWPSAPALVDNLHFRLPPGLVGDPGAVPACSAGDFATEVNEGNLCPDDSAVGVASVTAYEPKSAHLVVDRVPVFNLKPAAGEPARLGFAINPAGALTPVILRTAVPGGGDYAVEVSVEDASQIAQVLSSEVTLWGVPGDPRHDASRGWGCLKQGRSENEEFSCEPFPEPPKAFLDLPSACEAPQTTVRGQSWAAPPSVPAYEFGPVEPNPPFPALSGCPLAFDPSLSIEPEAHTASTPVGLNATVEMPQPGLLAPDGTAESAVLDTTVELPAGVQVNPSSANSLQACSPKAIGYSRRDTANGMLEFQTEAGETQRLQEGRLLSGEEQERLEREERRCPQASKLGSAELETPLLSEKLTGSVYLAEPAPNGETGKNPFGSLVALYVVVEDPKLGVQVKLAGEGKLNQANGQITTTFAGTPQVPFSEFRLHFFGREHEGSGEEREALSTPAFCGPGYATSAQFTGWASVLATPLVEPFQIVSGPGGSACPSGTLPFTPSLEAGTTVSRAGAFTSFTLDLDRADGDQQLTGISVHMPTGIAGLLAKLTPCPEPPVGGEWFCGAGSLIGHTIASAGLGGEPVSLPGTAYLTVGYDGAPFGVLVQTPAVAGPFNLGIVNVRSKIEVNPETAAVTIATDPGPHGDALPARLKGIPAQLKEVRVDVDRPEFLFNPTDCAPMSISGTLDGDEGASAGSSTPFQVQNCAGLQFQPALEASATGHASKANGTTFTVKVTSQGLGVANIQKVDLQLPKQLPSRLTTIQKACVAAVFEANPASCDEGSVIGYATIHTPVFKNPLSGPAYLVSHGGAAFPDVEFVLQGEGVKILLDGKTDIKDGITYSKFESAPDAPFTTFETVLPAGPHSALTANVAEAKKFDLCGEKLSMPTTIVAQNGARLESATKIAVAGCAQVKSAKARKLTLAQQLKRALSKCRSKYKHSKSRRAKCESKAHAHYTKLALSACAAQHKHSRKQRTTCEAQAKRRYGAAGAKGKG